MDTKTTEDYKAEPEALTAKFTSIPSGTLVPKFNGNKLEAPFVMEAEFTGDCAKGAYHQDVKGEFKADGQVVPHVLCGSVLLKKDVFQEDGCPPPTCTAYGHRACQPHPFNKYLPNMKDGCTYKGKDAPGISAAPGTKVEMDLSFRGCLINTDTGALLVAKEWKVKGSGTVPTTFNSSDARAIASGNTVSATVNHNTDGSGWTVSLLISGPPDPTPLAGEHLQVTARGADGTVFPLVSAPEGALIEVGGTNVTTKVAPFQLGLASTTPATLDVTVRGESFTLDLVASEDE